MTTKPLNPDGKVEVSGDFSPVGIVAGSSTEDAMRNVASCDHCEGWGGCDVTTPGGPDRDG